MKGHTGYIRDTVFCNYMSVFFFLGETSTIVGCFCGFVVPSAPEGSTGRLIFLLLALEKPGIKPATPGLQGE